MAKKKNKKLLVSFVLITAIGLGGFYVYHKIIGKVLLKDKTHIFIYIERNHTLEDVINTLHAVDILKDDEAFEWLAKKMDLDENIHPGKYRITNGMNIRQIINLIRYNKQEKVKLNFNSQIHNMDEFVEYVDDKLELSSNEIEDFITDEKKLAEYFGLHPDNCYAMVVPGVYELSWAASPVEFFKNLQTAFERVWKGRRSEIAKKLGFTVAEIITLASIVQSESAIRSEQIKIAGVYFNRLRKNMLLQADPTLKFANENYNVQRVLNVDKEINSRYNTYRYKGLPPGPICPVGTQAIDATLNYMRHNYIFFCARPQLNGFSDFSVSYEQHQKHANAYKNALNRRGIDR